MITPDEEVKYVEGGGSFCPKCGSNDISGISSMQMDANHGWQDVRCNNCEEEWQDVYSLTGIYQNETYEQDRPWYCNHFPEKPSGHCGCVLCRPNAESPCLCEKCENTVPGGY